MLAGVTGGTGRIGRRLVIRLHEMGYGVRVLARPTVDPRSLVDLPAEIYPGDILDQASLVSAFEGCDVVFHLAALVRLWARKRRWFMRVNYDGFQNVLEVATEVGVKRLVFTSSVRVLGPTGEGVADEGFCSQLYYHRSGYECSKKKCEQLVHAYLGRGLEIVTLYPTNIYGPSFVEGRILRLLSQVAYGKRIMVAGRGEGIENYVHVEDVVTGHILAAERAENGTRLILGGENVRFHELVSMVSRVVDHPATTVGIPFILLRCLAVLAETAALVGHTEPRLVRSWVDTAYHNWAYTSDRAIQSIGYGARSLFEGLTDTWAWLSQHSRMTIAVAGEEQ